MGVIGRLRCLFFGHRNGEVVRIEPRYGRIVHVQLCKRCRVMTGIWK
jgi:hypothetical protein